jgi:hypothetical protein
LEVWEFFGVYPMQPPTEAGGWQPPEEKKHSFFISEME